VSTPEVAVVKSSPDTPGDSSRRSGPRAGPRAAATELDLLNINEIATALRVSRMTVYRLIREARLPRFG
jgi:DNA invertase Pin-like site-specific DNA recombinase